MLNQIIRKLTRSRIEKEIDFVRQVRFPPKIEFWMEKYRSIGERDDFVFQWCYMINQDWMLVPIKNKLKKELSEVKTLFNMFIILVDDVSEKRGMKNFLYELIKIPFNSNNINFSILTKEQKKHLILASDVWLQINGLIRKFPRYKKIFSLFEFDVLQLSNAFLYGYFITEDPCRMNEFEYFSFFPHSMQIMINADLDLMCNETFEMREIGQFREAVLIAQKMARIGNWLTTWKREVSNGDFTSIVVPFLINNKNISWDEIFSPSKNELIKRIGNSNAEKFFLERWEILYLELKEKASHLKSIPNQRLVSRFEYLIFMHLMSRDLK